MIQPEWTVPRIWNWLVMYDGHFRSMPLKSLSQPEPQEPPKSVQCGSEGTISFPSDKHISKWIPTIHSIEPTMRESKWLEPLITFGYRNKFAHHQNGVHFSNESSTNTGIWKVESFGFWIFSAVSATVSSWKLFLIKLFWSNNQLFW